MANYTNLFRASLFTIVLIYVGAAFAWYNRFAYETSSSTSPIGNARQEEKYESQIGMIDSRAGERRELQSGQEAILVDQIGVATTEAQKRSARRWEKAGPFSSTRADDAERASEVRESRYQSKR